MEKLSKRQLEIVRLKMRGFRDKEISIKLDISYGTVRTHIDRAMLKLKCASMAQLVTIVCLKRGRKSGRKG